ncbi:MAG: hypothetical protein LUD15_06905 [Bacteroides sp.]|nr:hypothetical protein [Bacteroides sp.]
MTNSFNHSKLKKRITMMLKERSNPWVRLKYLYVLPAAAITLTAFARPELSSTLEEISAVKVSNLSAIAEVKKPKLFYRRNKKQLYALTLFPNGKFSR